MSDEEKPIAESGVSFTVPLRPDTLSKMLAHVYGNCDLCDAPLSPTLEGEFPGKRTTVLTCTGCGAIADLPEPPRIG